ncbi:hypothetical protein [Bacillus sp. FJAT-45066]|nr:hypothetical protein [Bacillus sp. FJAT-45066]
MFKPFKKHKIRGEQIHQEESKETTPLQRRKPKVSGCGCGKRKKRNY